MVFRLRKTLWKSGLLAGQSILLYYFIFATITINAIRNDTLSKQRLFSKVKLSISHELGKLQIICIYYYCSTLPEFIFQ